MEIHLESQIPTYSGGLGVLAGDVVRAAADLDLPMVAVSLLHRQGALRQTLDSEGLQSDSAYDWEPSDYLEPLDLRVEIELDGRQVVLRAWRYTIWGASNGIVPVYLLDSDLAENDASHRSLTGQLYGGDKAYRLRQEALLGLGALSLLRALGHQEIKTFHMNEGHASLLTIGLLDEIEGPDDSAASVEARVEKVRSHCVFTTHTPVPAGHERFPMQMVREVIGERLAQAISDGPCCQGDSLDTTQLALFFSRYINGVAYRHRQTAQDMFPAHQINSITNGVHAVTWTSEPFAELYDQEIPEWRRDRNYLRRASMLPLDDVRDAHKRAKALLFAEIESLSGVRLDPSVLTIGFARRAATYKRPDLIFSDIEALCAVVKESGPLQLVFAGKAHPHDEPGKAMIRRVFAGRDSLEGILPVVYLEEHSTALAKLLCSGVDLWLNTPERPNEASGTSGMKAALNGVPSLSVLDGWWVEGWIEGVTGWSIGENSKEGDSDKDLASLLNKLAYVIMPLFYDSPDAYAGVMRTAIAINGSFFNAQRMMEQYASDAYRFAAGKFAVSSEYTEPPV